MMEVLFGFGVALLGSLVGALLFLLVAPFLKDNWLNDPDNPNRIALFTEITPHRSKLRMKGGEVIHTIRGGPDEEPEWFDNKVLRAYQKYTLWLAGVHFVGIPGIHSIHSYELPHERGKMVNGKMELSPVLSDEPGGRSDHLRTGLTTWYFKLKGVDIQGISMEVTGSVQIAFEKGREADALFFSESWYKLLNQGLLGVVRDTARSNMTIAGVIGEVPKEIWGEQQPQKIDESVRNTAEQGLLNYTITYNGKSGTLEEHIGLDIGRLDFYDFHPETEGNENARLRAAAFERQEARARDLKGQGEKAYQKHVLDAMQGQDLGLAKETIWAEAAKTGQIDTILTALAKLLNRR